MTKDSGGEMPKGAIRICTNSPWCEPDQVCRCDKWEEDETLNEVDLVTRVDMVTREFHQKALDEAIKDAERKMMVRVFKCLPQMDRGSGSAVYGHNNAIDIAESNLLRLVKEMGLGEYKYFPQMNEIEFVENDASGKG